MEVTLRLHGVLAEHAGGRTALAVGLAAGATVADLLDALADEHAAVERRIRDEAGRVRRHVNVFVDGEAVRPRGRVDVALRDGAEVLVLPAVSGGAGEPGVLVPGGVSSGAGEDAGGGGAARG